MTFHKLAEQPPRTTSCTAGCTAHPLHHALRILAPWIVHSLDQLIVLQEPAQVPTPSECRLDCSFSSHYCMFVRVNHLEKGDSPRAAFGERADHKPVLLRKNDGNYRLRSNRGRSSAVYANLAKTFVICLTKFRQQFWQQLAHSRLCRHRSLHVIFTFRHSSGIYNIIFQNVVLLFTSFY